jgi:nucleoside-diphosphate-sugar epimerase
MLGSFAPDAILHLATRIPPISRQRSLSAWDENDRIRREGTQNLVDAALDNGVRVLVYPSVAFVYPSSGDRWVDATSTPAENPPQPILRSTRDAELEVERFSAAGRRGVILRMAALNGPDAPSSYEMLSLANKGVSPVPGRSNAFHPSILVDDAAAALVAALADRVPSGIYDVGDNEPLTGSELTAAIASAAGRRSLRSIPMWVLRLVAPVLAALAERSVRLSNRRFREVSAWTPTSLPEASGKCVSVGSAYVLQGLP